MWKRVLLSVMTLACCGFVFHFSVKRLQNEEDGFVLPVSRLHAPTEFFVVMGDRASGFRLAVLPEYSDSAQFKYNRKTQKDAITREWELSWPKVSLVWPDESCRLEMTRGDLVDMQAQIQGYLDAVCNASGRSYLRVSIALIDDDLTEGSVTLSLTIYRDKHICKTVFRTSKKEVIPIGYRETEFPDVISLFRHAFLSIIPIVILGIVALLTCDATPNGQR